MLENYYNKKIKTLTIPFYFNRKLSNLPIGIKKIIFEENIKKGESSKFNQIVDDLPNSVTHLIFGKKFYQSVDNLPNRMTHLIFGHDFSLTVDNLPNRLTHLTFGLCFNRSVNNLPRTLTHLTFGISFFQIANNLPCGLKEIKIEFYKLKLIKKIPFSCRIIDEYGCEFTTSELNDAEQEDYYPKS